MKKLTFFVLILAGLTVSACSAGQTPAVSGTQVPAAALTAEIPAEAGIEGMLAIGTLALEGSENAVTVEQAKALLPLWKAVNALTSSDTTTEAEILAVYSQIQAEMTAAQLEAIQAMDLRGEKMAELMNEFGIQPGGPAASADGSSGEGSFSGGMMGIPGGQAGRPEGGIGAAPGGGVMFPSGGAGPSVVFEGGVPPDMAEGMQTTPGVGQATGRRMMGMNTLFVQPLITLLKERAG